MFYCMFYFTCDRSFSEERFNGFTCRCWRFVSSSVEYSRLALKPGDDTLGKSGATK